MDAGAETSEVLDRAAAAGVRFESEERNAAGGALCFGVMHDLISTPSASTEHDPHCARPQPKRGPFSSNSFFRT